MAQVRLTGGSGADKILEQALAYLERGFSVIPTGRGKKPLLPWREFQNRRATKQEVTAWWQRCPRANVAIVTGAISGIVVLDVDGLEGQRTIRGKALPPTPCAATGKGWHYYFKHPGFEAANFVRKQPGLDFRGDGGYVLAPPSLHPSGRHYRWVDGLSLAEVELAPCPNWLLELLEPQGGQGTGRSAEDWRKLVARGVVEGARNNTVAALTGYLLRRFVDPLVVLELVLCWNQGKCKPPLADEEVVDIVDSIAGKELKRRQRRQKSDG